jgi:hypothetical protein
MALELVRVRVWARVLGQALAPEPVQGRVQAPGLGRAPACRSQ